MRRRWGRPEGTPVAGDRIMCLTNNRDLGVFNGQQFTVLESKDAVMGPTLTLQDDDGRTRSIPVFADGFAGLEMERQAKGSGAGLRGGRMLATFGQAITCHKSQGSEWGHVYVVNEIPNMMAMDTKRQGPKEAEAKARQWLYTAVTRASDRVTITTPNRNAR
jgi:exodeoxyribonuclease-5